MVEENKEKKVNKMPGSSDVPKKSWLKKRQETAKEQDKNLAEQVDEEAKSADKKAENKTPESLNDSQELSYKDRIKSEKEAYKASHQHMSKKQKIGFSVLAVIVILFVGLIYLFANVQTPEALYLDTKTFPQLQSGVSSTEAEVELETTAGNVTLKVFPKLTPKATENFLTLSKEGYYNNNEFFRVLKDFMIQTGSSGNSSAGNSKSIWGSGFATESSKLLYPIRGAVMLANAGTANSNGSQFFIVQNPESVQSLADKASIPQAIYKEYAHGGYPSLYNGYTVFGQVVSGMNVVDKIASAKVTAVTTSSGSSENSKPVNPVKIKTVKIIKGWDFKTNKQTNGTVVNSK